MVSPPPGRFHQKSLASCPSVLTRSNCRFQGGSLVVSEFINGLRAGVGRYSRLSDCFFAFLCQRVEVATACVQHACAYQLINGVEHAQPSFRIVARCLEEHMQVQAILPHCSE
jgi:hypothetical protein